MSLPLDDLIALTLRDAPGDIAATDQAAAAVAEAATDAGIDLTDPASARTVAFGCRCPLYIAAALGIQRGAMSHAVYVTAAAAARAQETHT